MGAMDANIFNQLRVNGGDVNKRLDYLGQVLAVLLTEQQRTNALLTGMAGQQAAAEAETALPQRLAQQGQVAAVPDEDSVGAGSRSTSWCARCRLTPRMAARPAWPPCLPGTSRPGGPERPGPAPQGRWPRRDLVPSAGRGRCPPRRCRDLGRHAHRVERFARALTRAAKRPSTASSRVRWRGAFPVLGHTPPSLMR